MKKFLNKIYTAFNEYKIKTVLPSLVFWLLIDTFRSIQKVLKREKKEFRIYGIYGFFGLWGQGKTMAMTKCLYDYRKKYGNNIYIFTNYGFKLENEPFSDWRMLLKTYDKPCVFAWDEVQNEFSSRDFKTFPVQLLTILTQNRKGNGKRILYSAQRWARVDKVFRELTMICYECRTRFGRLSSFRGYDWEDYEQLISSKIVQQKIKIKPKDRNIYVQTDYIRSLYDSFKMLESAEQKEYMDRLELANLSNQ